MHFPNSFYSCNGSSSSYLGKQCLHSQIDIPMPGTVVPSFRELTMTILFFALLIIELNWCSINLIREHGKLIDSSISVAG